MKNFIEYTFKYDEQPRIKIKYLGGFSTFRRNELCVRVDKEELLKILQIIDEQEVLLSIVGLPRLSLNKPSTEEQVK
jgi:hypothetical protein